jgi:hypothetical protein
MELADSRSEGKSDALQQLPVPITAGAPSNFGHCVELDDVVRTSRTTYFGGRSQSEVRRPVVVSDSRLG